MKAKKKAKYIPPEIKIILTIDLNTMGIIVTSAPKADSSKEMDSRHFEVPEEDKEYYDFLWGNGDLNKSHEQ